MLTASERAMSSDRPEYSRVSENVCVDDIIVQVVRWLSSSSIIYIYKYEFATCYNTRYHYV